MVVADIPGLAEAVTTGVGARVPADDARARAGVLAGRLADADLRAAEGRAAVLAASAFDVRRTYDQLAAVTAQVLPSRTVPHDRGLGRTNRAQRG